MDSTYQNISRRRFLGQLAIGTAGLLTLPEQLLSAGKKPKRWAIDQVVLGRSGIKVSRLGMGTGTQGGRVQRELGQTEFTRMIRYGLDQGITFIDTADNYDGIHEMLHDALKGVDRERIQIQCKIPGDKYENPLKELDRFRSEVGTDYFDSFLIHHMRAADWPQKQERLMDLLQEAKDKQIIRSHGVSVHGIPPLEAATKVKSWVDVSLVRVNHSGLHMDGPADQGKGPVPTMQPLHHIKKLHEDGKGVIGMKLIGNGDFTNPEQREASIRFVMGLDYVDAVVIGFKSTQEIDEAIRLMNAALNA